MESAYQSFCLVATGVPPLGAPSHETQSNLGLRSLVVPVILRSEAQRTLVIEAVTSRCQLPLSARARTETLAMDDDAKGEKGKR